MEKEIFITARILKYLEFWNLNMSKDPKYADMMKPYNNYWEAILEMLASPLPQESLVLLEGFWPTKNWMVNHSQLVEPSSLVSTNKEDTMLEPLCGPKNMKPTMKTTSYTPFIDLHNGDFVLTRPLNPKVYLVWLG
jgi:hypothetical protein